ncbi:hypothetical protein FRC11_003572 [Ceratobasidium sp. 423]|nr:hypothetical protein FRC11_003572 [Ceratobasidium sp. 423]
MARQQHSQPECKNTGTLLPSTQSDVLTLPHVITNVVLAQENKAVGELKKKLKNAKQGEEGAKIKIIKLENRADESCLQLSVACQATSDAEAVPQSAKFQVGTDAKEIARLNNRVNILEEKVLQISYDLLCTTKEIEMQEKRALALKYRWDADECWVRKEVHQLGSSSAEKKLQDVMDNASEDRAAAGRDRESKALAHRSNKEMKLASVKLLEDATYEKLASMRVRELDEQTDKLREVGGTHIRPKSMIGNKQAKIKELLAALEAYHHSMNKILNKNYSESDLMSMEVETNEMFDYDDHPEDLELYYDDEVTF